MQSFPWPDGKIAAAALTFDLDGETIPYLVDPDSASKRLSLMSEFSYGVNEGMARILDLLELYEIRATIFVPGREAELHPDLMREIRSRGHDLESHGYMHERPDGLSDELELKVLEKGIEVLESITGEKPTGYRSPAAEMKPTTPALLAEHGYRYDSSLMGSDYPYVVPTSHGDLVELPMYWHIDDWPLFGFVSVPPVGNGISAPSAAFELWAESFEEIHRRGALFNVCMHPLLAGRPAGLRLLEKLIRFISGFPRVWWAPLSEIDMHCRKPEVMATMVRREAEIAEPRWIS
ncbi:MAG TPA: polysaccharide deacetylase [Solirubrobacterales bacterium]